MNIYYRYPIQIIRMTLTSASFYVLLAMSKGPCHGLGIADDVAAFTEGEILLGPGTLYRCLKDLSDVGAIERVEVDEPPGISHRKHYGLTPSGATEIQQRLIKLDRVLAIGRARVEVPSLQSA